MDGFGDDFVPVEKPTNDVDPAAEFLAREQNELAGLDDDLSPNPAPSNTLTGTAVTNGASENDLFMDIPPVVKEEEGDGSDLFTEHANGTDGAFEGLDQGSFVPSWGFTEEGNKGSETFSSLPNLEGERETLPQETVDPPHGSILGGETSDTGLDEVVESAPSPVPPPVREEPEKIRIWRENQEKRLKEKDSAEEKAKEELRDKAKKELEEWYKQHEDQVTKTRQANRSAEKELVADTSKMEPGTEWERISKLCDFNPKTAKSSRDISRMRSIILQVKQNPPVKA